MDIIEHIKSLKKQPRTRTKDELVELYWQKHPRFLFFKNLPQKAKLLDIGAGSGGLVHWKLWGTPRRDDLEIFGVDLKKGDCFDEYVDHQIANLENIEFKWPADFFDAILISHVLEHIHEPILLLKKLSDLLKNDGLIYIEIPAIETMEYPSRKKFLNNNINVSTINLFDDNTHLKTYSLEDAFKLLPHNTFSIVNSGKIRRQEVENDLINHGIQNNDQETTTYGVWSKLEWAQHITLQKKPT